MKKNRKSRISLLFLVTLILVCTFTACKKETTDEQQIEQNQQQKEDLTFDQYMDQMLKEDLSSDLTVFVQFVENPSDYGITDYQHALAGPGKENFDLETKKCEERLAQLTSYDYNTLTHEQQLTYDTLKTYLENRIEIKDCCYYQEPLSTLDGDHIILPGIMGLHASRYFETMNLRNIQDISYVEEYFYVYETLGNYLKEIAQFEREKADQGLFMSEESAAEVIKVCKEIVDSEGSSISGSFEDEVNKTSWITEDDKLKLFETNTKLVKEHMVSGYQAIIDAMKDCGPRGGKSKGFYETELGKKYYEYILKSEINSNVTPEEMAAKLDEYLPKWTEEKNQIIQNNPTIMNSINTKLAKYQNEDLLIEDINRNAVKDFPNADLDWGIKDMPETMNGFAMGLFYPQPLDSTQTHHTIYAGTQLMPGSSNYVETIGHEGVPGHLYNYTYYSNLDITPYRRFNSWVKSTGFLEGWTTYIEKYIYLYTGLTEEEAQYLELLRLLDLGIVARADVGVNYYGWSTTELSEYFVKNDAAMYVLASDYVKKVVQSSPNSYGPYCMGYIYLTEMKDEMKEKMGADFSDLAFHKAYLDVGPTTFDLMRKELLGQ